MISPHENIFKRLMIVFIHRWMHTIHVKVVARFFKNVYLRIWITIVMINTLSQRFVDIITFLSKFCWIVGELTNLKKYLQQNWTIKKVLASIREPWNIYYLERQNKRMAFSDKSASRYFRCVYQVFPGALTWKGLI